MLICSSILGYTEGNWQSHETSLDSNQTMHFFQMQFDFQKFLHLSGTAKVINIVVQSLLTLFFKKRLPCFWNSSMF